MNRSVTARWMVTIVFAATLWGAGPARAGNESDLETGARKVFDLTLLRPLGFVQTVVSGAFLLVGMPIAAATGTTDQLVEICWTQPVDQTFRRPLGEL